MNRISVVMKMYVKDKTTWFIMPWSILSLIFVVNWIISSVLDHPLYTGGFSYFFIYFMVLGITSLVFTFPFALSFSVRRKDFFLGTAAMSIGVSAISAFIFTLLAIVEKTLSGWGSELHFFNLPYLNDGSLLEQFWVFFATLLHLYFLGAVIAGVYVRYSGRGVYILMTILLLISTICTFFATRLGWWIDIFHWLKTHTAFELASWMGLIAVFYALITYLLLRRATVQ